LWADAAGRMQVRVSIFLPIETWQSVMALVRQRGFMLSQWLHIGGVKAFADGSLGTRTALFHKAYADDNSNYGLLALDLDWFQEAVLGADNAGLQWCQRMGHEIGASGLSMLSIYLLEHLSVSKQVEL
jgi:predicted amidohydrolase YtcJ